MRSIGLQTYTRKSSYSYRVAIELSVRVKQGQQTAHWCCHVHTITQSVGMYIKCLALLTARLNKYLSCSMHFTFQRNVHALVAWHITTQLFIH